MRIVLFLSACLVIAGAPASSFADTSPAKFEARDFGAVGDGKTDDTAALQKALDAAAAAGTGEVDLPAGTYRTGSLVLKSHVTLHLDSNAILHGSDDPALYPIATARWEGIERPCHRALISADHADGIAITGSGILEGSTQAGRLRNPRGPTLIEPIECRNVRVEGVTLESTCMWTLHPAFCQDVLIQNVKFDTHDFNSDGIDPDSCQRVTIDGCVFSTDDDNIAIKSGKGQEGVKMARPCEYISITNCTFQKGYSSIAFGSELSGGIQHVHISNCTFQKGRAALYLKSRPGRGGFVRDVTVENVVVGPEPLLEIQEDYPANPDAQGVPGINGLTAFSDIHISDAKVNGKRMVKIRGRPDKPVIDISLHNVTGTCREPFIIQNATGVELKDIHLAGLSGPMVQAKNAQGTGLEQAAPSNM